MAGASSARRGVAAGACFAVATFAVLAAVARAADKPPNFSDYDALLRKYVRPAGVRYAAWRADDADRLALKTFLVRMENVDVEKLAAAPNGRVATLAFWINLYNAATLDLVLEDYPVKTIKELGGGASTPWQRNITASGGHALTLDQIENEIIRPRFHEPRVHFALNCAAKSCPPLRAGVYVADSLETQLDRQTRAFLAHNVAVGDGSSPKVHISKIFDWYAKDFGASDSAVAHWLRPYVPALAALPEDGKVEFKYDTYDWALNDSREP
jgi:hypothetical protein